ncbi:unnamed protein product [Malus baccata var. baccata]
MGVRRKVSSKPVWWDHQQSYGSLQRQKLPAPGGVPYPRPVSTNYAYDEEEDKTDDDDELGEEKEDNNGQNGYPFVHKVPHPLAAAPSTPRHSIGGQNGLIDWIECETFVLQDAWGDPFLQRGKKVFALRNGKKLQRKYQRCPRLK